MPADPAASRPAAISTDYIELDKLLKRENLAASGGEARALIDQGLVRVNGEVETRRRRKCTLKKPDEVANGFWKDFWTGFLFTFANPLIVFFIIGLFARFNFLLPEFRFYHYIAGYGAIVGGALLWWWLITYFVNKARAHFNVRSLWIFNRIVASILFIMASISAVISGARF